MASRHRMTRAELNERAWELKKVKKKKGLARGTRSNPNIIEVDASTSTNQSPTTNKAPKVVRAIPLNIPGREQPLVSEKVVKEYAQQATVETNESLSDVVNPVDLVVKNGRLVDANTVTTKKAKASKSKTKSLSKANETPVKAVKAIKLGKAALKRLEREEVGFGEEMDFFENEAKEKATKRKLAKKEAKPEISPFEKDVNNTSNRVMSRDYKAGRNTDYVRNQANAEKAIRVKKSTKPTKRSGEELLDLWESLK